MYCQSCGAQNPADARFCNMCGARIAPPGAPGGMIPDGTVQGVGSESAPAAVPAAAPMGAFAPAAAPDVRVPTEPMRQASAPGPSGSENVWAQHEGAGSASRSYGAASASYGPGAASSSYGPTGYAPDAGGPSMSSVSLQAIGVKSSGKTWAVITLVAVLLVALGAIGAWLSMGGESPSEPVAGAEPEHPMEIGTPLPEGMDVPEVDFVSGGVRVTDQSATKRAGSGGSGSGGSGGSGSGSGGTTTIGGTSTGGAGGAGGTATGAGGGAGSGGSGGASGGAGSGGSASGSGTGSGSGAGGSGGSAGAGSSGGSGGASGGGGGTVPEGELPEERDIALEMYASRVRFVIRRYYATRAQSCFDRATRNDPSLRGTVVVRFTIAADGSVSESSATRNTTGNSELGGCLAAQVRSWRLPAPPGGELTLEMPFSN